MSRLLTAPPSPMDPQRGSHPATQPEGMDGAGEAPIEDSAGKPAAPDMAQAEQLLPVPLEPPEGSPGL